MELMSMFMFILLPYSDFKLRFIVYQTGLKVESYNSRCMVRKVLHEEYFS